ncbi:MAG: sigma-70 family RNA polymerase sigma factor [Peptococcaceae bacterium]|nr:sigma-70 family RNA polymerase sigma factor [Peptococcaceae bacterium]
MPDNEIIRQVLAGRHEVFALLVERYQKPLVYFLCRVTPTREEAYDFAQEAFLAAYRHLWRYSEQYTFRAWLFRIGRNLALDDYRKRRRAVVVPEALTDQLAETRPGPEDQCVMKEEQVMLRQAMEQLPEHYRSVLYLRYQQELTYEEISVALNIPLSRVKTHLHRAKKYLRQDLERRAKDERIRGSVRGKAPLDA